MDKRTFPRIAAHLPATVTNEDGVKLNVFTLDTSCEGVRIECSTAERDLMTPGGCFIRNGRPVELLVWLDLPVTNGKQAKIAARCHITFSRRVAKDVCQIGMRYLDIENDGYEKLLHFIEHSSASNNIAFN